MKQGAGEDPFAEDADVSDDAEAGPTTDRASESSSDATPTDAEVDSPESGQETAQTDDATRSSSAETTMQVPYTLRRDSVQDGRDRYPLFLQSETKRAERDALHDLEDQFDGNVSLTDLREALVLAGLDHLDEVEAQLRTWGYGLTFD
nr:hypothetical protein [Halomarina sp. PSRA2]